MTALLSQPGAIHNEWSHAAAIWCGRGERDQFCPEIEASSNGIRLARTNIAYENCWSSQTSPRICPKSVSDEESVKIPIGTSLSVFNFSLSWLVVPSVDVSLLLIRLSNALFFSVIVGLLYALLPGRYRVTLSLLTVIVCATPGVFLLTSASPITWMSVGVGLGWLPLHASITQRKLERSRRHKLAAFGALLLMAGLASDRNSIPQILIVAMLLGGHLSWLHFHENRKFLLRFYSAIGIAILLSIEWLTHQLARLFWIVESDDNPATHIDSTIKSFSFVRDFLPVFPKVTGLLFGFPGWNVTDSRLLTVSLPELVGFGGIALLGFFFVKTFRWGEPLQVGGIGMTFCFLALFFFARTNFEDGVVTDVTVAYPLIVFMVGWWLLLSGSQRLTSLDPARKPMAVIATTLFALMVFAVAERFVDRQSFGLRYLPEGRDQWWWSWMPVGPNVVVILAPLFLWKFFSPILVLTQKTDDHMVEE